MLCIHTASFFYHADNVGPSSPRSRHFCGDSERCKLKRKDKEELVDLLRQKYLLIKEYMKRVEKKKKVEDGEERGGTGKGRRGDGTDNVDNSRDWASAIDENAGPISLSTTRGSQMRMRRKARKKWKMKTRDTAAVSALPSTFPIFLAISTHEIFIQFDAHYCCPERIKFSMNGL